MSASPSLIILGGLPGVGKTAIARELARQTGAVHVRIDSIEQALRDSGAITGAMDDHGYRVAYAAAEDELRLGRDVIADCVNPLQLTRTAWREVAKHCGAISIEVEITCSDQTEHRRRVERRDNDIPALKLPTWDGVLGRKYEQWDREHLTVDSAASSIEEIVAQIRRALIDSGYRK